MKEKKIMLGILAGLSLFTLSACGSGLETSKSTSHSVTSSAQPKTSSSSAVRQKKESQSSQDVLKNEESFVQRFLEAYTSYDSLNAQKAALKPFLTPRLQKQLGIETPASPDVNQVTSTGQALSIWHNDSGKWLGLVTLTINGQTSSVQVFLIGLEANGNSYLVASLSSPTQE